jgi:peptidoglycan/xylan/chitin deacetylase (PgdA/CDA1 family)
MVVPGFSTLRNLMVGARREPVLSILIFHRVLEMADPMAAGAVTQREFDRIAGTLRRFFNCYSLSEAVARLDAGMPGHMVSITFDDGYADNLEVAMPVLRRHQLPATIFVAARYLDGGIMWNDVVCEAISRTRKSSLDFDLIDQNSVLLSDIDKRQRARKKVINALKYLPQPEREQLASDIARQLDVTPRSDLMLSSQQLIELSEDPLIEIGGHTYSHPILTATDETTAAKEITEGKSVLEDIIGQPVLGFAYPNGQPGKDYGPEHAHIARESGFAYAVSTAWGAARSDADRFQLPRFTPWHRNATAFAASLLRMAGRD